MTKTVEVLDALMGSGKTYVTPTHEVYVAKAGDYVLYVGEGKVGRHKHCRGGVSHVYGLNLCHFTNTEVTVEVVHLSDSKVECEKLESELIRSLKPALNKAINNVQMSFVVKQLIGRKIEHAGKGSYCAALLQHVLDNNDIDRMLGGFMLDKNTNSPMYKAMIRSKKFNQLFEEVPYITNARCFRIRQSLLKSSQAAHETNT